MARPGLGTRCVQAGYSPKNGEPRQIPIIQSTTFKYESSAEMGKLFDLEASGYFYSRLQNPTNDAVAARIAALEGGTAAMLTGSGMSAIFFSVFNIVGAGDHLVSSSSIYGGSFNLFSVTMKRMGVEVTFVDPDCSPEELDAAFRPNTKAMYGETIANPALTVLDIEKFAAAAHRHGVPLILDNTFATPINCRPFEWGADIVVHSTTKYMDGHAGALGGAIVDSGRFDWTKYPDKYPGLCTPDESYHGVTYAERFGLAGAYITKATVQLMRDLGAVQSPQNAYYLNLGLESLHVRMQRHCENAQRVAEFLQRHENVSWVQYCGLPGDKYYELGQKYLPNGSCGVVSFGVRGGRAAAEAVMSKLQVAAIETHVADSHTCCLHPASTTHRQMNAEELLAAGVREDLIRYSCGLEDAEDLIDDLDQALR
ncbi:MAG: O-acetylhomoserine aminocarboxypropyltransferase/cysteine synthase [Clostridiales bacterium]|nr:O-acetylhomoserine aminocarboxypropyltransferase/cysteine synthase [Clostridiales bacterium]